MSADDFFDTNILIYATLDDDPRGRVARELLVSGGCVSVQVLNEFANVASRKLRRTWPDIRARLDELRALLAPPRPITLETHEAALGLVARYKLAFFDALVMASALEFRLQKLCSRRTCTMDWSSTGA